MSCLRFAATFNARILSIGATNRFVFGFILHSFLRCSIHRLTSIIIVIGVWLGAMTVLSWGEMRVVIGCSKSESRFVKSIFFENSGGSSSLLSPRSRLSWLDIWRRFAGIIGTFGVVYTVFLSLRSDLDLLERLLWSLIGVRSLPSELMKYRSSSSISSVSFFW